jgi:hypothetical protein
MTEQLELQNIGSQTEGKLGIKLRNRLMSIADASQLILVDRDLNGRKVTGQLLRPHFRPEDVPSLPSDEMSDFYEQLPQTLEVMLFVNGQTSLKESYVNGIGGEDVENLARVGSDLAANRGESSGVVTRLVFGGTKEMPLRGLSYLLPPLLMMENMKVKGIDAPQLQVIFANNISSGLGDHLQYEEVAEQSEQFAQVAQAYIEEYFPEQLENVAFFEDAPMKKGSFLRDELISIARVANTGFSEETKERLNGKGKNSSKRLNKFYGAAHVLMHDIALPEVIFPLPLDQPEAVVPKTIISFGGHQEKDFYRARHELKKHLGAEYNSVSTLQYFTRHKAPPYYMSRDGDVSLDAVLAGNIPDVNSLPRTARVDLEFLHAMTCVRGNVDFGDFLAMQRVRSAA